MRDLEKEQMDTEDFWGSDVHSKQYLHMMASPNDSSRQSLYTNLISFIVIKSNFILFNQILRNII